MFSQRVASHDVTAHAAVSPKDMAAQKDFFNTALPI